MLPDPVRGFVERRDLTDRCDLLAHAVTCFHAPGGFGKTTVLAHLCQQVRERGLVAAWLTAEKDHEPDSLGSYLLLSLKEAGLTPIDHTGLDPSDPDYRLKRIIYSIEEHRADCVIAIDQADELGNEGTLLLLQRLMRHSPGNLHLALAFREIPDGLDIATTVLQDSGLVVTAEDLRFGKREIVRFFNAKLSRKELASVEDKTLGWPIALCLSRNLGDIEGDGSVEDVAANWIETRLWQGMSPDDRLLVMKAGQLATFDADLLEQAISRSALRRLKAMPSLHGLLGSVGDSAALSLHPLIRAYCRVQLLRDSPALYRRTHVAIAQALSRRNDVISAMRHAIEADDAGLAARILEDAGGIRLFLRQGRYVLLGVNRYLKPEIVANYPRVALAHCGALAISGSVDAAERIYFETHARTEGFKRDRKGGADLKLQCEELIVRGLFALCRCLDMTSPILTGLVDELRTMVDRKDIDPLARGTYWFGLCFVECMQANFEMARHCAFKAKEHTASSSQFLSMFTDLHIGSAAMAEGRADEAAQAYRRGQGVAKRNFFRDGTPSMLADVLMVELALERSQKVPDIDRVHNPSSLADNAAWFDVHAASADVALEIALRNGELIGAQRQLQRNLDFARRMNIPALGDCLVALQVSVLVETGQLESASSLWSDSRLPCEVNDCIDFPKRGWRATETIACARVRLLAARGKLIAAAQLADALVAAAESRGLLRTQTWALALSMEIEHRAGQPARAQSRLIEYLRLFAQTDYSRGLVRVRKCALPLMGALADSRTPPELRAARQRLAAILVAVNARPNDDALAFTPRQHDILLRLENSLDKEIAFRLNLTEAGVRYHVKKIFRKLNVNNRLDAVARAREAGILPPG